MITSSRNPKDFINAQVRGKELIVRSHELNGVDYDKNQSVLIENLIDLNVFDYDEYSYTLILTDEYNSHLKIYNNANLEDIVNKKKVIERLAIDINSRIKNNENYDSELKKVAINLRAIKRAIEKNIDTLNDKQIRFKGEVNLNIRMNNLQDCKEDLEVLSESIKIIDTFILENKLFFFENIESESIRFHINKLSAYLRDARKNVRKVLDELTKYLVQIELEAKRIEHIKSIYKLKYSGELYEKTNAEIIFKEVKQIGSKLKINSHYRNDYDFMDQVYDEYKKTQSHTDKPLDTKQHIKPAPIKRDTIKETRNPTVSVRVAYLKFIKQDKPLEEFLNTIPNLDRKKYLSLYIRIVINYSNHLHISKKDTVTSRGFILPIVKRKGL